MITIHKNPPFINPVFNPIIIQVSSTEQTRTDFQYLVYVSDDLGARIATMKKYGGANLTDKIDVDVSGVLKRRHKFDFWRYDVLNDVVTGLPQYIYRAGSYKIGFNVQIFDYYDGAAQGSGPSIPTATTLPIALSSYRFAYFDYNSQIRNVNGRWLTNFDVIKHRRTDKTTVSFLNGVEGCSSFNYYFYDSNNNLLATVAKVNPYGSPAGFEDVYHVHAGLQEVAVWTGISNTVRDQTARYVIKQNNLKPLEFQIVEEDVRFPGVRIHYLNEWGAIDSFLFSLAARRSTSIEKRKAKLPLNNPLRPSMYGVGKSPYIVSFTDKVKLTSDYITENDSNALLELFTSPLMAVETEQNLFFPSTVGQKIILPCDLEVNDYEFKQINLDRLFNLELEVKISVDNTRQSL